MKKIIGKFLAHMMDIYKNLEQFMKEKLNFIQNKVNLLDLIKY